MLIAMMLGLRKAYKDRRQHCEYKCLYKSHKYLEHIYKYGKQHRYKSHCTTNNGAYDHCHKYNAHKGKHHSMSRKDICEETYHKRKRLYEHSKDLYYRH